MNVKKFSFEALIISDTNNTYYDDISVQTELKQIYSQFINTTYNQ